MQPHGVPPCRAVSPSLGAFLILGRGRCQFRLLARSLTWRGERWIWTSWPPPPAHRATWWSTAGAAGRITRALPRSLPAGPWIRVDRMMRAAGNGAFMPLRITTWNVNSVRPRLAGLERLVREIGPDVLCLQETKVTNDRFPVTDLEALGFRHACCTARPAIMASRCSRSCRSRMPKRSPGAARTTVGTCACGFRASSSCTTCMCRPAAAFRIPKSTPNSPTNSSSWRR